MYSTDTSKNIKVMSVVGILILTLFLVAVTFLSFRGLSYEGVRPLLSQAAEESGSGQKPLVCTRCENAGGVEHCVQRYKEKETEVYSWLRSQYPQWF